jgi:hypothetical protein
MSESFSKLRAFGNNLLFTFLDQTTGDKGKFVERSRGVIIVPVLDSAQASSHRWGKVQSVGSKVDGVQPGDYILIEALMWTPASSFNGEKIWKTNDEKVLCVTDDIGLTLTF